MSSDRGPEALAQAILAGQRGALAKAITLSESSRDDHRAQALDILEMVGPHTGASIRLGVSGPPGVGKSTFIEALGLYAGRTRAPSGRVGGGSLLGVSGGSILGDKTRMESSVAPRTSFHTSFSRPGTRWAA